MSKIEVNTVDAQCGSTITVGSSGKNVKIEGNDIRSNDYKASDGGNIINQSGTTITLGASGDTISLASGATQSGFGRTGTVDWDTTPKTSDFTAVNGDGFFVNTTSGAITVTLPAGSPGSIVSLKDYANTWDTNNVTVTPNGTDKINGVNANAVLNTEDQSVTLVYVDSTKGWRVVQDSTSSVDGATFITATGGTITTCGNFKIHTFTGPGTFCVSGLSNSPTLNNVDYLVVGGGGGSGQFWGGGGGAGGARMSAGTLTGCYTVGPLGSGVSALPVSASPFPITVGGGGNNGSSAPGVNGVNSVFSTITSAGGGYGTGGPPPHPVTAGGPGGSGGGMGSPNSGNGGTGNTPPVSPPQGQPGGPAGNPGSGGGGGATQAGQPDSIATGGTGVANNINPATGQSCGPARYYAGGGGGAGGSPNPGYKAGGLGGGGAGQVSGTANTGGGGGSDGGSGGSGIVIIRYKFQ